MDHDDATPMLTAIATAFDEHYLDAIMAHFADDALFFFFFLRGNGRQPSRGPATSPSSVVNWTWDPDQVGKGRDAQASGALAVRGLRKRLSATNEPALRPAHRSVGFRYSTLSVGDGASPPYTSPIRSSASGSRARSTK